MARPRDETIVECDQQNAAHLAKIRERHLVRLRRERDLQIEELAERARHPGFAQFMEPGRRKLARIESEIAAIGRGERLWQRSGNKQMSDKHLIARVAFSSGNMHFPRGSEVTREQISQWPNGQALLDTRTIVESLKPPTTKARPLPEVKAEPVRRPVKVEIVPDSDAVASWQKTEAAMVEACDGDRARARDLLFGDVRGSELYRRAAAVDAERAARADPALSYRRIVRL